MASIIAESLHYRNSRVYRLDAFTIMANHVHMVIKPLQKHPTQAPFKSNWRTAGEVEYYSLAGIMQSLKGYTAFQANQVLGREGEFWAHEIYDHWIRDSDEWQRVIAYVLNNPLKGGYVKNWKDWKWNYRRV